MNEGPNFEEQSNELMVLESIFSSSDSEEDLMFERFSEDSNPMHQGQFACRLHLPQKVEIVVASERNERRAEISHLPPVYLQFQLGPDYPSSCPPRFSLSAVWLTSDLRSKLAGRLHEIWKDNQGFPVLYSWIEALVEESVSWWLAQTPLDLDSLHFSQYCGGQLMDILLDFHQLARQREFQNGWYLCEICLEEKSGRDSMEFHPCGHVFCRACVRGYFELLITEGNVQQLKCLAGKCDSEATPTQVREAVPSDGVYERYETLLLTKSLGLMSDVVFCPRPSCQQPVVLEAVSDSPAIQAFRASNAASCAVCGFTFCTYCRKVYHGINTCDLNSKDRVKLVSEYRDGTSDVKKFLELKYGKLVLERLVDDSLAEEWIREKSKSCPQCKVNIEKRDGCNKIWCWHCDHFFCWLCLSLINTQDPYKHFQSPSAPCFNKLFYGVEMDPDDRLDWL